MDSRFLNMIPFLWEWEGTKYENDPDDPGGETKYGIDKRSHPNVDIRNLTEDQAKEIYWTLYWQKYGCGDLPTPLGEVFFNAVVNTGSKRARTLLAESDRSPVSFLNAQAGFYERLVAARPKSKKYLRGWLNRIAALRAYLHI